MVKKGGKFKKILLIAAIIIGVLGVIFFAGMSILYNSYALDVNKLTSVNNGVKVYSASGTASSLYNTNRSIITLDSLPDYVVKAFIATEDKRFYKHHGYDLKRIVKAGIVNFSSNSKSQGASTISQQLVKNALLTNEKTYKRKLKEIILAIKMEKQFNKNQILEMYLNTIYFGSNAYGIENASKIYFNKSATELSLNEACFLAGIIKSPSRYTNSANHADAIARKNMVAKLMFEEKYISASELDEVLNSDIELNLNNYDCSYEEEAIFEACSLLNITERELINRNYQIITYKDDNLQNEIISACSDVIGNENLDSLTCIGTNSGEILAYFASSNFNLHNIKRQPASLLKPLAVYLPCITHNILTPSSRIMDEEIDYSGFKPKNADGKFHGVVSARYALANSLNIPSVKLLDSLGLKKSVDCLNNLGIATSKDDLNLTLALGNISKGVKLLDIFNAYSTLANMGVKNEMCFVNKILDFDGNIVYEREPFSENVVSPSDAYLLNDMLRDSVKYGTAKRLSQLNVPICSKTGTAFNGKDNTDLYNVAYTSQHTILSWISNLKDNKLDNSLHSSVEPTEINKRVLSYLYSSTPCPDFTKPDDVVKLPYDINEANNNLRIVSPTTNLDRYISYDYFKKDFPPAEIFVEPNLNLRVEIENSCANIIFNTKNNHEYKIIKIADGNESLLQTVTDHFGEYLYTDKNIFKYAEICYKIVVDGKETCTTIRPKDYLINKLNNQFLTGKSKWYV